MCNGPKPDRLLTDEKITEVVTKVLKNMPMPYTPTAREEVVKQIIVFAKVVTKEQDTVTASIVADQKDDEYMKDVGTIVKACQKKLVKKEAECQERVERILREIETNNLKYRAHKDGIAHYCPNCDCSIIGMEEHDYQALKKREGVK